MAHIGKLEWSSRRSVGVAIYINDQPSFACLMPQSVDRIEGAVLDLTP